MVKNTPKKWVVYTDIHFGLRNNERRHNQECEDFIKWMIEEAHEFGAEHAVFCGDFHHYRSSVQTSTLNYSISAFERLSKSFKEYYHIIGNHDLFYKDKREIHSCEFAREYKNVHLVNDFVRLGDILFCPWLVGDEWKKLKNETSPYVFGHFEIPTFYMNAMIQMPDHGKIQADTFCTPDQWVFSGHFHKRQMVKNIHDTNVGYIGNCFPHSYSDAGDDDRGIMLLELGKPPIFKKWPGAPKFRCLSLGEVLADPDKHLDHLTNIKIQVDIDLNYEETKFVRDMIIKEYGIRELKILPRKNTEQELEMMGDVKFENVDQIVTDQLNAMPDGSMDKSLLIDIYHNLV